ncbi:MAG: hypothetical protein E7Z85_04015 [Methanosphaera stadtmanae]|nr:hypothetical protein [Methanosphaera stadtmanae]
MGIIINTNSREEYNDKINYYKMNGFKVKSASSMNLQTHLEKKNIGPSWVPILLITSLIGSFVYLTDLVLYPLAISDFFIKLNFFSLVLAVKYLQDMGLILLIIFIAMILIAVYYYMYKPYEVIVKVNKQNNNQYIKNNSNVNDYNPNRGNFNG